MVFLNYHLEGTIFLLFSDHNSQLRNTLLQFNVNQMNVPGSIMLLACFLVLNCSSGNADFQMIFYDSRGQITNRLTITDIRSVRWDDQCYFISDDKLNEIMKLNLQGGRIEMIFKNDVLASIEAFSVYSSRLPSGSRH